MSHALSLRPVGRGDYDLVAHITIAPEHIKFAGTVREAFAADEAEVDLHGIWLGRQAVGFFKIDRGYAKRIGFVRRGELGLRAFMIDQGVQGRGVATAAVRALPAYLTTQYPDARSIALTVNMTNPAALACYLAGGFVKTGQVWPHGIAGPQHFMRMEVSAA